MHRVDWIMRGTKRSETKDTPPDLPSDPSPRLELGGALRSNCDRAATMCGESAERVA